MPKCFCSMGIYSKCRISCDANLERFWWAIIVEFCGVCSHRIVDSDVMKIIIIRLLTGTLVFVILQTHLFEKESWTIAILEWNQKKGLSQFNRFILCINRRAISSLQKIKNLTPTKHIDKLEFFLE